jgi:Ca2+-binding EF-hand superfamily protein
MLVVNPSRRISVMEALNDAWIKKYTTGNIGAKGNLKVGNQMQQAVLAHIANHLQSKERMEEMKVIFQNLDKNGDGVLGIKELQEGYIKVGKSQKIVENLLKRIDLNNNGTMDCTEFLMTNLENN